MEPEERIPLWIRDFNNNETLDPLDRISQNPIHVLQHILSFLSSEDAARTSVLSRKWGRVWCQSLLKLFLTNHRLDDHIVQAMLDNSFCGVESLNMKECIGLTNFRLSSYKLTKVDLLKCRGLEKVEMVAPNLETFYHDGFISMPCEIELPVSKNLKHLKLYGVHLINNLFEYYISKFPVLETLYLGGCNMLENIKISSHSLKELIVYKWHNLVEIKVDTPNLLYFMYMGDTIASFLPSNSLNLVEAVITLETDVHETFWFHKLTQFLVIFNLCELLIWRTNSDQNIIIFEELRGSLLPPLYGLKELEVELRSTSINFVALVDCILWSSPRLESLVIRWHFKEKNLLFQYDEDHPGEHSNYSCCKTHPFRCWRHTLAEVAIDTYQDEEGKDLRDYFHRNLKDVGCNIEFLLVMMED